MAQKPASSAYIPFASGSQALIGAMSINWCYGCLQPIPILFGGTGKVALRSLLLISCWRNFALNPVIFLGWEVERLWRSAGR